MTGFPPEFLDEAFRDLPTILLRSAMIAHRREHTIEHLLDALDGVLVPDLTEHRLFRFNGQQRRRGNAAERKARPPHPADVVTIEHHRRCHGADVIEATLGDLVETDQCRHRLWNLDAPDDLSTLEGGLPVTREERCQRLHARSSGSND